MRLANGLPGAVPLGAVRDTDVFVVYSDETM